MFLTKLSYALLDAYRTINNVYWILASKGIPDSLILNLVLDSVWLQSGLYIQPQSGNQLTVVNLDTDVNLYTDCCPGYVLLTCF